MKGRVGFFGGAESPASSLVCILVNKFLICYSTRAYAEGSFGVSIHTALRNGRTSSYFANVSKLYYVPRSNSLIRLGRSSEMISVTKSVEYYEKNRDYFDVLFGYNGTYE